MNIKRIAVATGGVFVAIKILNEIYRKTNHFRNQWTVLEEYQRRIPKDAKLVNFGSTYSKFAFGSYQELGLCGCSMALEAQSIEMDSLLFAEYSDYFATDCIVLFVIAPCTLLLYRDEEHISSGQYYEVLSPKKIPNYDIRKDLKQKNPLYFNPKLIQYIFNDELPQNIYDKYPAHISEYNSKARIQSQVKGWTELFGLKDLQSIKFSTKNNQDMKQTTKILEELLNDCIKKGFHPAIVIPPFSDRMNMHFSDEFVDEVLHKNIKIAIGNNNIPVFNYRKHEAFQQDYRSYGDGGFCLNKRGSLKFMKLLLHDLAESELKKFL